LTLGQWPWRRDVIGRLITRLREMGASVIGLDIIFAEADRLEMPDPGPDGSRLSPDEVLAGVLREGRVLLGYGDL
jgi:Predicted transmembrane sensor domain